MESMPTDLKGHVNSNKDGSYTVFINSKLSLKEQREVYEHETYHIMNKDFEKINVDAIEKKAHSYRDILWAYDKQVGLQGIISAFKANRMNSNEMAEYLNVTEEFLKRAIECYHSKYGLYTALDNYIIGFEPVLYVMERFE